MTAQQAKAQLDAALIRCEAGHWRFGSRNGLVTVRLAGALDPLRFSSRDRVVFLVDELGLRAEEVTTRAPRHWFKWQQAEWLTAGEPETANGSLFQG